MSTKMAAQFDVTPEKRASALSFIKRQLFRKTQQVTRAEANLEGKTVIVTGANRGLGLECSRQLLKLGASKLILAVRTVPNGEAAQAELANDKVNHHQSIEVWKLDLSSYDSILKFIDQVKTLDRLDILVHNAGISQKNLHINRDTGHCETVQTNYISLVLLTGLLLPIFKGKNSTEKPGRLVLLSSETAAWAPFKERNQRPILSALDKEQEDFDGMARYWTSKLLGQLFLSELVTRVPASVAIVNAVNPGMCSSDLASDWSSGAMGVATGVLQGAIGRSPALGARAITDAAVRHGVESHGHYLEDGKLQPCVHPFHTHPQPQSSFRFSLLTACL
jgi:NAD(P)-dependent dehydrogenase (short-subunit alcohol dehydrogenase family)